MPELMMGALDLALEISRIGAMVGDPHFQLDMLWEPISAVVPFVAAWIGLADTDRCRYLTASSVGHDRAARAYLESREFGELLNSGSLMRRRTPMCLRDAPLPAMEYPSWAEHWWPAGYREGLGLPLVARDGRQLGVLTLYTDTAEHPTDAARDALGSVAPMIAAAVDPMTTIAGLGGLVADARAATVVTRGGAAYPMPGLPSHPGLTTGSPVVSTALLKLCNRHTHTVFLCPWPAGEGPADYVSVTAIACAPQRPPYLTAVILLSPCGDLHGLTRRELEVLGLLIEGRANSHIATSLFITERTVAAHLEHIRAKLDAPSRTVAAVRSLQQGLYIPRQLIDVDTALRKQLQEVAT